jgi:CRISPR-associated protein Csb1
MLTAHLEAFGAARVGRSGVKFDRLGKTTSRQPIFGVDDETAESIRGTFIIDLALLRSYGRDGRDGSSGVGLSRKQKELLLALALWKIRELLSRSFSYRSGCKLRMRDVTVKTDAQNDCDKPLATELPTVEIKAAITAAEFADGAVTFVYYPADKLFKLGKDKKDNKTDDADDDDEDGDEGGDD